MGERLTDLQIDNPYVLTVYRTIENCKRTQESKLHHFFRKYHVRGEWFAITTEMIDEVCDMIANGSEK